MKQKYVLIRPNYDGTEVQFFSSIESDKHTRTKYLSEAHVFNETPETMQYILDRMREFSHYSAVPMSEVDIFKAKLAGV